MAWWDSNRLRLIQNNLRETDAAMDVDLAIRELKRYRANVWMMNAGGIFAFYPSALEYQYVTPYLKGDLLGEAVEKAHAAGMRFIARFDFSKAHESVFAKRPEWFYRTKSGEAVNYNGIVHTCLNSEYQQRYSLRILDEVLSRYPVDGVFFNMFGYQTRDYSGVDYGLCYCGNCRTRFRDMHGLELPEAADPNDPVYRAYRTFQETTARLTLETVRDAVKAKSPDIAVSTYHHHGVDIVRNESNTALSRPHPVWLYSASDNVMTIEDSWEGKLVSNCSINAVDLPFRFTGVSPHETEIRLYESIASGSGLDFCIIGSFADYTDRTNLAAVQDVYSYHAENESRYGDLRSAAEVVLVKPDARQPAAASREYRGLFRMLKEHHAVFEAVQLEALPGKYGSSARSAMGEADGVAKQAAGPADPPPGLKAVLLPGIQRLGAAELDTLRALQAAGVALIATGSAFREEPAAARDLFGVAHEGALPDTLAAYVAIDDRTLHPGMPLKDWVFVDGRFDRVTVAVEAEADRAAADAGTAGKAVTEAAAAGRVAEAVKAATERDAAIGAEAASARPVGEAAEIAPRTVTRSYRRALPLVEPSTFGPPERAYGHRVGQAPGCVLGEAADGAGMTAYYPWEPGALYYRHGFEDHMTLVTDVLDRVLGAERKLTTDAPASVELFLHRQADGSHLLQLLNLSGFNGTTYRAPLPLRDIRIALRGIGRPAEAYSLPHKRTLALTQEEGGVSLTVPELGLFEAIVLHPAADTEAAGRILPQEGSA